MRQFFRNNGLSIAMLALFLVSLVGQSLTGFHEFNESQRDHAQTAIGFWQYLSTGHFLESVFENWESEFLQMGMYIVLTALLHQKGSAESKSPGKYEAVDEDPETVSPSRKKQAPSPVREGGWRLKLYKHSLSIALFSLFLISFFLHAASGAREYSQDQAQHGKHAVVSMWQYLGTSRFWFESFQNWQSEFLSVFAIIVLSIYLRQEGSPESKPVATPHDEEAA